MTDGDHRVLKFRPRTHARPRTGAGQGNQAPDLSQFENGRESPDDYRHRMMTNVAAIAFTAALTGIGIWLAMTLADLRNTQDCILMGRRDGLSRVDEFEDRHVRETVAQLTSRSTAIAERVAAGTLAVAGVGYHLADGRAVLLDHVGDIGE